MFKKFKILFISKTNRTSILFLRSIFVGGIAATADMGMVYVLVDFINIHYLISSTLGFIFGILINYYLSIFWVFEKKKLKRKTVEFTIFAIIGILGLLLNNLIMWFFTDIVTFHYLLSKIIAIILVFIFNFFTRKKILF